MYIYIYIHMYTCQSVQPEARAFVQSLFEQRELLLQEAPGGLPLAGY